MGSGSGTQGTYTELVVRDDGTQPGGIKGDLDFLYKISVTSGDSLTRITGSSYAGWSTDAGYLTGSFGSLTGGDFAPTTIDRNPGSGNRVGFNFPLGPPDLSLQPGHSSEILVVKTNAADYTAGKIGLIDSVTENLDGFAPGPEPSSMILLCTGIACMGGFAWRRRKVATA
jgi:hypothetical protein